jgi:hypothetical protein
MSLLVLNHGFLINLRYDTSALSTVLQCLERARAAALSLRIHPEAVVADVGGLPLRQWIATAAHDRSTRDDGLAVQQILDSGPFLDLELAVSRGAVQPDPGPPPFGELVCAGLGEAVATEQRAALLSAGDRGSGLVAPDWHYEEQVLPNLRTIAALEAALRAADQAAARDRAEALARVDAQFPDVGIGQDLRQDIERGRVKLLGPQLLRAVEAAQAAAAARREGGDWRAAWQQVFSAPLKDESDTVHRSPTLRALRRFRLRSGERQLVFDHAHAANGQVIYVWVPAEGNPEIVAWTPHLPPQRY